MLNNQRILAIIPARGGSKGVPKKNLRHFKNQSLLAHTINTAKASSLIDMVMVSSENADIIAEAILNGAEVPFSRPAELAEDNSPTIDCVLHALERLKDFDYVVLLQVTSPLRTAQDIDDCIKHCFQHQAPACVSVTIPNKHPFWMYTLNDKQQLKPLFSENVPTRRQDFPAVYALNGAIYVAKINWLQKNKSFVTAETIAFEMPAEKSLDIDTELDFLILKSYEEVV